MQILIKRCLIVFVWHLIRESGAVHFFGGGLSAKYLGTSSGQLYMRFTQRLTWRNSMVGSWTCDPLAKSNQWAFGGPTNLTCVNQCYLNPPETIGQFYAVCMSYSTADDWGYGEYSWNRVVSSSAPDYRIQWVDVNWDTTLLSDGANTPWSIGLKLDTRIRADIGTVNSSPYTIIPPLFKLRQGYVHQFLLASSDLNNDDIRCRFGSSFFECGGICKVNGSPKEIPANLTSNCIFTFNGVGKQAGLYAVGVIFEDFATSTSTTPMSSVPAQFLIKLVADNGNTCTKPPVLTSERQENSCFSAPFSVLFSSTFTAKSSCPSINILSIEILGLKGSTVSSLAQVSGTTDQWKVTLTWTPTSSNTDNPNVVCGLATDSNYMIDLYCFTVLGGISAPSLVQTSVSPSGDVTNLLAASINWRIDFNTNIIRAKNPAYIKIYSSTGVLMLSFDASSSSLVSISGQTISFTTSLNFPSGNYYILFDYGVALGTQFCNIASNEVTSTSFWTFSVAATTTTPTTTTTATTTPTTTTTATTTSTTTTTATTTPTTTTTATTTSTTTTTATTTPTTTLQLKENVQQTGDTIGIVVGTVLGIAFIFLIVFIIFMCCKFEVRLLSCLEEFKRKARRKKKVLNNRIEPIVHSSTNSTPTNLSETKSYKMITYFYPQTYYSHYSNYNVLFKKYRKV